MSKSILEFDAYFFDLDGTVYLADQMIPGADRTIAELRRLGKHVLFLTNKAISTCAGYASKLTDMAIPATGDEVISSSLALAGWIAGRMPAARLFVVGEQALCEDLSAHGLTLTADARDADAVVISWDRCVTYEKLRAAALAIRAGAHFFATNLDVATPTPDGLIPEAGSFVAFMEAATSRKVELQAGKPGPMMVDFALAKLGIAAGQALMVGDRLDTDIAGGVAAGTATCLVLTGAVTREQLAESALQPDFVLDSIADMLG